MLLTTLAQKKRPMRKSTQQSKRRPVYQVALQGDRQVRHKKRHIDELPRPLRILMKCFIGACLGWAVLIGVGLAAFLVLFARVASLVLPQVLAHFS